MKVCIVQPPYSTDHSQSERYFNWEMDAFDRCDETMDLIVFPEAADIPCMAHSHADVLDSVGRYFDKIYKKASETAKRCSSILVFNGHYMTEQGHYNTTFVFDRSGSEVGKYFKQHLTPKETAVYKAVGDYSFEYTKPTVIELEGLRFCFLTCYDFYFYEYFPVLARQKPDIIIGCSHQRSDMQSALDTINSFVAYHTNSYVVRASVSMGEDTDIGGGSCVVAPNGKMLLNMRSRVGLETVEIDPLVKYYKPAGFGNPPAAHYEYIEAGRRPWKYRPAGSAMVKHDSLMPYPRTCAHRGFYTIAPENSMPAFGAAVDMGAEEIEFDLWYTSDGEIVSIHDDRLERVSNGSGKVYEHTLDELKALDFGSKHSSEFSGLKILTFEEILKKLTCRVIMNIHVKTVDNEVTYDPALLDKIMSLIKQYDCEKWVYITSGNDHLIKQVKASYPDIKCCVGGGNSPDRVVERAIEFGCEKVQFVKPHLSAEKTALAHSHGIACNVFWSDDPEECEGFLEMGVDTVLTNDYHRISQVVNKYAKYNI